MSNFLLKGPILKGETKKNVIVEKLDTHHLSQAIEGTCRYNNAVQKQVKFNRDCFFFFRLEINLFEY